MKKEIKEVEGGWRDADGFISYEDFITLGEALVPLLEEHGYEIVGDLYEKAKDDKQRGELRKLYWWFTNVFLPAKIEETKKKLKEK